MTLQELQQEVAAWQKKQPWDQNATAPLLGLIEEVGELSHAHLKQQQKIRGTYEEHQIAKIDAVGDILIYLADYCGKNAIDMQSALDITWRRVSKRNWSTDAQHGGEGK